MSWEWKLAIGMVVGFVIVLAFFAVCAALAARQNPPKPLDVQTTDELFNRWKPQGGAR